MAKVKANWQHYSLASFALLGALLAVVLIAYLLAEIFWFQEVGYLQTLVLRLLAQAILGGGGAALTAWFLIGNLQLAKRLKYRLPTPETNPSPDRYSNQNPWVGKAKKQFQRRGLKLRSLLPLVLLLSAIAGLMLLHYARLALEFWQASLSLTDISPQVPPRFQPQLLLDLLMQLPQRPWELAIGITIVGLVVWDAQRYLTAIATVMSLGFGLTLAGHWSRILQFFYIVPFNRTDPLFSLDISTYTFILPVLELLGFWLVGMVVYGLVSIALIYLLAGNSISQGYCPGFAQAQQRHLYGLASLLMLVVAFSYLLDCFELLYSTTGVVYGASYTDVSVTLPADIALGIGSFILAALLIGRTIYWRETKWLYPRRLLVGVGGYLIFAAMTGVILPGMVQSLVVQPSELERERPYIEHNIAFTRRAFDLTNIEVRTFEPEANLTQADLATNETTIDNIRLWDARPLLATNRQLQQIRLYYRFPDADIDRYSLQAQDEVTGELLQQTRSQQVIIAPRELDYEAVPDQAKTWINEHLIYTHGYGFTLSPVNTAGPGGLPDYFVKDIGVETATEGSSTLGLSSEIIRNSIPIGKPRIYYGELTNNYVMTSTKVQELDYPSGNDNVYNTYDGSGGIRLASLWQKLAFAVYLRDWQMLLTRNFTPETKVLFRRNIRDRIQAIAPFLRYDQDAYLVVANANLRQTPEGLKEVKPENTTSSPSYLYWIVDAYTTSDRYPYSDPGEESFNYIRNSVKVVIDAYNGSVDFYIADPRDPIVQVWNKVFPNMFKPLDEMPPALRSHIRYPTDLFSIQSERLLTYHMIDPQVFYNREDQWQVPNEIYANEPRPVAPYYLIMRLPKEDKEEFILLHPFTPTSRNNLIAWLAGRSDGDNYGKLLLYQFPKQRLVYGPEQIEARINQDPVISQRISLWNRQGSRAVQGNLLVIPIEESLLYVEPVYLEAERNSLPTLARVIVAYGDQISMAPSLSTSLEAIFKPSSLEEESAILRQVDSELLLEESLPSPEETESPFPSPSPGVTTPPN